MSQSQEKPSKKADETSEGSQNLYRRPDKPKPKPQESKPIQVLESITNEAGDVFNPGDQIQVTSPWGPKASAQITGFYQDPSGNAWVQYKSNESRPGWTWEGGCILAALLVKA